MPANKGRNDPGLVDLAPQALSSPNRVADFAANDQGVFQVGPSARMGDPLPLLGVELTCYRLLNAMIVIIWAVTKAILSYKNRSIAATTVDLLAAQFGVVLYLVGLYEKKPGRTWEWFFRVDLAPAFGSFAKFFFRGVVWALSFLCDILVFHPFISLFLLCVCLRLARFLPVWGAAVVSIGLTFPIVIIFVGLVVRATSGRS
ncbi:hypothetical protein BJY52DRAFT_1309038 [Lactarius psammicola]|nr:hypothetical protein BJY52DRAFT_1309038 [Lactarius psammicola]